ncbi:hypothetical protein KCP73_17770 [Salmonella enterica subsp. enterica]|nr:hypothetical protein KCP73_17770 [Salmonella enterica subsp. enterica]
MRDVEFRCCAGPSPGVRFNRFSDSQSLPRWTGVRRAPSPGELANALLALLPVLEPGWLAQRFRWRDWILVWM